MIVSAFQDYGRAVIIGDQTFGKGSVNDVSRVRNQESLWHLVVEALSPTELSGYAAVTLGFYYRLTGASIQKTGVTPDLYLPQIHQSEIGSESDYKNPLDVKPIAPIVFERMNHPWVQEIPLLKERLESLKEDSLGILTGVIPEAFYYDADGQTIHYEPFLEKQKKEVAGAQRNENYLGWIFSLF